MHRSLRIPAVMTALALGAAFAAGVPAAAQMGGPGFAFRPPTVSLSMHAGYAVPLAGSDLFDQTIDDLILDRSDFAGPAFGGELAVRASERWDVSLEVGHSWSETRAEWRDFVEDDGAPIWQVVSFSRTPVTVSGTYYLVDRGRRIGRFVWIPARVAPFVGAGVGVMRFRFAQEGDFVDYQTLEIYRDFLEHVGAGFTAHAQAGLDVHLSGPLFLTTQGRYEWGRAELDRSVYEGFEPVDLSGFRFTLGFGARF